MGVEKQNFFYVLFNSKFSKKELKIMQKLEIKFENELDLTLLDNEFFIAMLNQIMSFKKCEVQNGLSQN